jgi:hypothetical protein
VDFVHKRFLMFTISNATHYKEGERILGQSKYTQGLFGWTWKKTWFELMTDWYEITLKQITEHGGRRLLEKYGDSPSELVISVYSQHKWRESWFNLKPRYWDDRVNQREFLDRLGHQLEFKKMEDWYHITAKQIEHMKGGYSLLSK